MESPEKELLGMLLEAVDFAARKHRDQRRKDEHQTPYINHPIGVAYLLWKEGGVTDITVLQVSLLHIIKRDITPRFPYYFLLVDFEVFARPYKPMLGIGDLLSR